MLVANPDRYLYAISDGEWIKIGYAVNPIARMAELQCGNPRALELCWKLRVPRWKKAHSTGVSAKNHEAKLHRLCAAYHKRGEWFDTPALKLCFAYEEALKITRIDNGTN